MHSASHARTAAAGVWWFPPLVLQTAAFALAFCLGVLIYVISFYAWRGRDNAQAVRACAVPRPAAPWQLHISWRGDTRRFTLTCLE
jgi:hypothetical protein